MTAGSDDLAVRRAGVDDVEPAVLVIALEQAGAEGLWPSPPSYDQGPRRRWSRRRRCEMSAAIDHQERL
jgi:hypothetical protein